jgi:indolepyruvate ferredoxin oxidoreductase
LPATTIAKRSTAAHHSYYIFNPCCLPVCFPSIVQDILDMGLHAFALSRFAGVWSGMKTIQEVVESSASVAVDPDRVDIILPEDFRMPPGGLHIRWPDPPLEQEARLMDYKWYAALAYVRANRLNYNVIEGPNDRFGIIASGKAYNDTRQALHDLGLDDATCRRIGLRLHKVNVVWPLEATITRDFAEGLQEILVVEEKRQVIEYQLKEELYGWRPDVRPHVLGKFDESEGDQAGGEWSQANPSQHWLLRAQADLSPAIIARAIAKRLGKLGVDGDIAAGMAMRIALIDAKEKSLASANAAAASGATATGERAPWFCSGCPHNTSTKVPEGSRAVAGIGCHYMAVWMDRSTVSFSQMGGEGVSWVGQAPFTTDNHIFANLGDGTYYHSGLLAVRQAIAAKVNITYKILFNDAVAMTGGQPNDGGLTVPQIARQVAAEGARRVVVVTDEPWKYAKNEEWPRGLTIHHRDELIPIQQELAAIPGVTVLIYDQTCAAEKRRRRKRGRFPDPDKRVIINELVCEGCGDCGVKSNCVSVQPLETEWGRKRTIDQSSCNKDFSCVKGFCPSFVTVHGAKLKRGTGIAGAQALTPLPDPKLPAIAKTYDIIVTGVGGTGVVTIGGILGMAAHLEGKGVGILDMAGLAQKGGAVYSHIRLAERPEDIHAIRIAAGGANLVLGGDIVVAGNKKVLAAVKHGTTEMVINLAEVLPGDFTRNADFSLPTERLKRAILADAGAEKTHFIDATRAATALLGNSIGSNIFLVGYAYQLGAVPLSAASIMQAIELNGEAVEMNQAAFHWGRRAACEPAAVEALIKPAPDALSDARILSHSFEEMVARRGAYLTAFQDAAYAARYRRCVEEVKALEAARAPGKSGLADAVGRYLFKLMAYKDEYEVARLYADVSFAKQVRSELGGEHLRLYVHLAPPLLARADKVTGEPKKMTFGPWIFPLFRLLAKFKFLRGTAFDPFGYTVERRRERALVREYEMMLEEVLARLSGANHHIAVALAAIPEKIRGFGHVKMRHLKAAKAEEAALLDQLRTGPAPLLKAAE